MYAVMTNMAKSIWTWEGEYIIDIINHDRNLKYKPYQEKNLS